MQQQEIVLALLSFPLQNCLLFCHCKGQAVGGKCMLAAANLGFSDTSTSRYNSETEAAIASNELESVWNLHFSSVRVTTL